MKRHKLLFVFLLCLQSILSAQDIHFSQFKASPLNLNPGLTGDFNDDYRIMINHRNQWQAVTVPFITLSAGIDFNLFSLAPAIQGLLGADKLSAGLVFNRDKAGDSEFGITQLALSLSYSKYLTSNHKHAATIGISSGYTQKGYDFSKLKFSSQYDGTQYDPNYGMQEVILDDKISYSDFAAGFSYHFQPSDSLQFNLGAGIFHFNKPQESFFNNNDIRLDSRLSIHGGMTYLINSTIDLIPSLMYYKQGSFQEFTIGTSIKYKLKPKTPETTTTEKDTKKPSLTAIYIGGWMRMQDAVIAQLGMDYKKFYFGFSYDINISKLKVASNKRGGFELALIYHFTQKPIKKPSVPQEYHICPVYL